MFLNVLVLLTCGHMNLSPAKLVNVFSHFHLHGSGAWLGQQDGMMHMAAVQAFVAEAVAQALVAMAAGRGSSSGSSGPASQIHKALHALGEVGAIGLEGVAEYQLATHAHHVKSGALSDIVEWMELHEIATENPGSRDDPGGVSHPLCCSNPKHPKTSKNIVLFHAFSLGFRPQRHNG